MFDHLLVALDNPDRARQALSIVGRIAHATQASVTLVRVVKPDHEPDTSNTSDADYPEGAAESDFDEARDFLEGLLDHNDLEGIGVTIEVRTGDPAREILACAQERRAYLVILCGRDTTALARWLLGGVAQEVARLSPVPVLILREHHPLVLLPGQVARLLVPLDESSMAEAALLPAAQLSAALSFPAHGSLHLVQVVQIATSPDMGGYRAEIYDQDVERAHAYLSKVKQRLHEGDFAPLQLTVTSEVVLHVDTASALLRLAEGDEQVQDADSDAMIAMATHGRGGWKRLLLGSVTERILATSSLPLLVVHPEQPPSQEELALEEQWREKV